MNLPPPVLIVFDYPGTPEMRIVQRCSACGKITADYQFNAASDDPELGGPEGEKAARAWYDHAMLYHLPQGGTA